MFNFSLLSSKFFHTDMMRLCNECDKLTKYKTDNECDKLVQLRINEYYYATSKK